jgi:hypothetical protein
LSCAPPIAVDFREIQGAGGKISAPPRAVDRDKAAPGDQLQKSMFTFGKMQV